MSKGGENKPERGALAEYLILNLETTQKTKSAAPENQRQRRTDRPRDREGAGEIFCGSAKSNCEKWKMIDETGKIFQTLHY